MSTPDKAQVYNVIIMRRNQDHIIAVETENYDEAYEVWTKLKGVWLNALKEEIPFEMEKPIVTAFDPGLIFEIRVLPVTVSKSTRHNPYAAEMQREGFTKTFGKISGQGSDLLDKGYT